mgnify:CR=1 FL=1
MSNTKYTNEACTECLIHAAAVERLAPRIQAKCDDIANRAAIELIRSDVARMETVLGVTDESQQQPNVDVVRTNCVESEITAICQHSDLYPSQLRDLDVPPRVIFCRGNTRLVTEMDPDDMVSIVGARKATGYGLEVAGTLSADLYKRGAAVVSGLALGIDGAAHLRALGYGNTIAVVACGADRPYPTSHARLYQQIVERGVVVSEVVPGGDVWRWRFPARNRIIAALSAATVVVEAAEASGSLVTADMAQRLGRFVGAVPGPVTSTASAGSNNLIRDGIAKLVANANDIPVGARV